MCPVFGGGASGGRGGLGYDPMNWGWGVVMGLEGGRWREKRVCDDLLCGVRRWKRKTGSWIKPT